MTDAKSTEQSEQDRLPVYRSSKSLDTVNSQQKEDSAVNQGQGKVSTFVYKVDDGVEIEADIYLPNDIASRPMPIGMSLSYNAIASVH